MTGAAWALVAILTIAAATGIWINNTPRERKRP